MTIEEWLRAATADAERRQLAELAPRLVALAEATRQLRGTSWNREAVPPTPVPPSHKETEPPSPPTREGEAAPPVPAPPTPKEP